jgi:pSer/pThr/pTyr-binding forkhead associated (FHA) protein
MALRVTLEVQTGSSTGQQIVVRTGESVTIGRAAPSDFTVSDDTHMSGRHFRIECGEHTCTLRDLKSSNGTMLNGHGAAIALLRNEDTIIAGKTSFSVQTVQEGVERPMATVASPGGSVTPQDRLLSLFRNEFQPLYALLDAAVDPSVLKVLLESKEQYQSLYQGSSGAQLTHFAPYLVRLPKESGLLETLVKQGWGKNWGVYLTCDQPLDELRKHFRSFLMVAMPDGKKAYFRFYDPRVLRAYLPTCTAEEINQFFGPITNYFAEAGNGRRAMRFAPSGKGLEKQFLNISPKPDNREANGVAAVPAAMWSPHSLADEVQ